MGFLQVIVKKEKKTSQIPARFLFLVEWNQVMRILFCFLLHFGICDFYFGKITKDNQLETRYLVIMFGLEEILQL